MPEFYSFTGERLESDVRAKFGDDADVQIQDADILRWINDGQRSIANIHAFLKGIAKTDLQAGETRYNLSELFGRKRIRNYDAILVDGATANFVNWEEYRRMQEADPTSTGTPTIVSEFGDSLLFYPKPDVTLVRGIEVYYTAFPEDLQVLADPLRVPDRYFDQLSDYVYARMLELDESWDAAKAKRKDFADGMQGQVGAEERSPTGYFSTVADAYPAVFNEETGWLLP